jgi:hypothetical protein
MWCAVVALGAAVAIAVCVTAITLVHAGPAKRVERHGVPVLAEVTHKGDYTVSVRYRVAGDERDRVGRAPADFPDDFRAGIRYPAHADLEDRSFIRLDAVPFDTVEPLAWAWVGTVLPSIWLTMAWKHRRRVRLVARTGPWRPLGAWVLIAQHRRWLLGLNGAGAGAMTAAVWIEPPRVAVGWPGPGALTVEVAGVVEPGQTVALRGPGSPLVVLDKALAP